ncbi:MAG: BREX system Lon protease-like protein BrxL [Deltaproteobacteria bacterium]|nr:BREX system Lon protease-like protein BrxL [Deltaproteobacteria bacterium]
MNQLDKKINQQFPGLVVRKDLVKIVKGNAIVPTYVLEYLLGQYCATDDDATIKTGIETVKEILRKHFVHRNEAMSVRSTIKEKGRYKVIDKISVILNDKADVYEASFSNLGVNKVLVSTETVKKNPKLLVSGIWCLADLEYTHSEDAKACPWILDTLKPIQLSKFDYDAYIQTRKQFTTTEWVDLLIQSMGFNPDKFDERGKLIQLLRLVPYCERNYNLIELGPKGTGKSHIYAEFSPHGILISGGEVTVAKLFVNNSNGKIGLVGYWDTVAFDEFAGRKKTANKALVDIMKNYMANKSFSRGIETLGAEASMVFIGNTQNSVPHMLKHSDLFDELPEQYHDSAFLDRIHYYIPGWEVDIIRGEMFSSGYGFIVDYLAEILRTFRNHDFSQKYTSHFTLSSDISTRDRDGINKTFSGLMKVLFPHEEATKDEIEFLLQFAIEGRKRVKDQLFRIDPTYTEVRFSYTDQSSKEILTKTKEEELYPDIYWNKASKAVGFKKEITNLPEPPKVVNQSGVVGADDTTGSVEVFEGYELITELLSAGMAEVYKAKRQDEDGYVLVKRVKTGSCNQEALEREMCIYDKLMRTKNKYFVEIRNRIRTDDYIGIVTDFLEGGDLEQYVQRKNNGKGLEVSEAKRIGINVAEAIREIHAQDIVHRDLKPANILYAVQDDIWKLTDFGISKNLSRLMTQKTFQKAGTLGYTAPEQFEGVQAMPSADIYSFGKMLVYLLTGQTDPDLVPYPKWKAIITACVDVAPDKRPSIGGVIVKLGEVVS